MDRKKMVQQDSEVIDKSMSHYTGNDGAHFGFIAFESGERQFFAGGRVDISGICLGEALATLVLNTPGIEDGFIDAVADTAKMMLNDARNGKGVVQ